MDDKQPTNEPTPSEPTERAERKQVEKIFFLFIFYLTIAIFIIFLTIDFLDKEKEPGNVDIDTPATVEADLPEIERDVYYIGEHPEKLLDLFKEQGFNETTLSDALSVKNPSFFLVDFASMNPLIDRPYTDLLNEKHGVIFTGIQLDASEIVSIFSENDIPVVPLEGTFPTFFQAYGAVYSTKSEMEIPVFLATNRTTDYDVNGLIKTLDLLESHLSEK